jgi:hypothetical protein
MMKKSLTERSFYHLPTWKPVCESIFKTLLTGFQQNIVGFSQENFKRFYKLPKVRQLTDCLYNVAFGDLNFNLGKTCLPESKERNSKAVH